VIFGAGAGVKNQIVATASKSNADAPAAQNHFLVREVVTSAGVAAVSFPDVVSRFSRFRSARNSLALW